MAVNACPAECKKQSPGTNKNVPDHIEIKIGPEGQGKWSARDYVEEPIVRRT